MHMDLGYFPGAPTYLVSGYLFRVQAHSIIPLLPRVYIFGSLNLDNIISSPSPNKSLLEADSFVQLHLLMDSVNVGIFMARFPPIRVTRRMLRLGSVVPNAGGVPSDMQRKEGDGHLSADADCPIVPLGLTSHAEWCQLDAALFQTMARELS
jgi:hypothetical protein